MDRDTARERLKGELRGYVERITQKSKGKNMYVCPLCGSGTGSHSTGAFNISKEDGTRWKCFSCGKDGDIFDLIGEYEGIADHSEQLKRAGDLYGITIDSYRGSAQESPREYQKQPITEQNTHTNIHNTEHTKERQREAETDYTGFFLQAHKHITETDYPQRRGLSMEITDRFKLGYVESWRHPKAPNAPPSPRLIIPTSKHSYLARDTRAELTDEQKAYSKSKVGSIHPFNSRALQTASKPIFITEGEIDALSIIEVGGEAAMRSQLRLEGYL